MLTHYLPSSYLWNVRQKFWFQFKKGSLKKISYERRDYESVDEKSLS